MTEFKLVTPPNYKYKIFIVEDVCITTREDISWWKRLILKWVFRFKLEKI